ncbi:MAG: hypothetical protein ACERKO_12665, partial [Acetanaerobacterium sp.]
LNAFVPLIAKNLLEMLDLLNNTLPVFTERCIKGIRANEMVCREGAEHSAALCTALIPYLGYDRACELAMQCAQTGKTARELVTEQGLMDAQALDTLFSPQHLTAPYQLKKSFNGGSTGKGGSSI